MKSCSENRNRIACMTLNTLDPREERELRAHIESCDRCRSYLSEISSVTEMLWATESRTDIRASESFHRRVTGAVRAEQSRSWWNAAGALLRGAALNWRVALPALGAAMVMIAVTVHFGRRPGVPVPHSPGVQTVLTTNAPDDLAPTIANYQWVANQSLDQLDQLLTRQANRPLPPAPRLYGFEP